MKRKAEQKLSFFKILTKTDFDRLLRLTRVFMRKYGSIFPKNVKLKIEAGRTWNVKVEAMDNGLFCFKRGWKFFAQDVGLKFGEVLFFTLNGDGFTLDVSVFETNGCKKEILDDDDDDDDNDDDHDGDDDDDDDDDDGDDDDDDDDGDDDDDVRMASRSRETRNPLYYEIVLKTHNRYRVNLKRELARAANLFGKNRVVLQGERQNVSVVVDNTHVDGNRFDLTLGWGDFRFVNGLVVGKTYSFEFKQNKNVIQVKEVKMGV